MRRPNARCISGSVSYFLKKYKNIMIYIFINRYIQNSVRTWNRKNRRSCPRRLEKLFYQFFDSFNKIRLFFAPLIFSNKKHGVVHYKYIQQQQRFISLETSKLLSPHLVAYNYTGPKLHLNPNHYKSAPNQPFHPANFHLLEDPLVA